MLSYVLSVLDRRFGKLFGDMKHPKPSVYPMHHQVRPLLDLFVGGESGVLGLEHLACDPPFIQLAGGVDLCIETVGRAGLIR